MTNKRLVSHPGVYVKEALEELGLNQSEFAMRAGLTSKTVSTLISGTSNITFEVAVKLAAFFQNDPEGWLNLQTRYDLFMRETTDAMEINKDWEIARLFDKSYFINFAGIAIDSKNKVESVNALRKLFRVGTLQALKRPDMYAFCKTSVQKDVDETSIIMRNAWILLAEDRARSMQCGAFNKERILKNLPYLRGLTRMPPELFEPKLKEVLRDSGIKLVILPYLSKSNVGGVTKWIAVDENVMMAVNDCGKDADRIWFAIFHELGHAIQNHRRHMTISYTKNEIEDKEEREANEFAKDALIDKSAYNAFVSAGQFDLASIEAFAAKENVADFIVIGRLQKEGHLSWAAYQHKKIKYEVAF